MMLILVKPVSFILIGGRTLGACGSSATAAAGTGAGAGACCLGWADRKQGWGIAGSRSSKGGAWNAACSGAAQRSGSPGREAQLTTAALASTLAIFSLEMMTLGACGRGGAGAGLLGLVRGPAGLAGPRSGP